MNKKILGVNVLWHFWFDKHKGRMKVASRMFWCFFGGGKMGKLRFAFLFFPVLNVQQFFRECQKMVATNVLNSSARTNPH